MTPRRSDRAQRHPPDPSALTGFPAADSLLGPWFREHADRPAAADRGCWRFSGRAPGDDPGGRFDLLLPDGTCYLGETIGVAVRERCGRFLAAHQPIPRPHLDGRVVATVRLPEPGGPVADTTQPDAALFGVTGELASGSDYALTAAWAQAFHDAGFGGGLYYLPRFTPGREHALALFGPSGRREWGVVGNPLPLVDALRTIGYDPSRSGIPSTAATVDDDAEPDDG